LNLPACTSATGGVVEDDVGLEVLLAVVFEPDDLARRGRWWPDAAEDGDTRVLVAVAVEIDERKRDTGPTGRGRPGRVRSSDRAGRRTDDTVAAASQAITSGIPSAVEVHDLEVGDERPVAGAGAELGE